MITTTARAWLGDQISKHALNHPTLIGLEVTAGDPDPAVRDIFGKVSTWDTAQIGELATQTADTYDVIVCLEALGTVQNVTAVLGQLSTLIKPGGWVLVTGRIWGGAPAPGDRMDRPTGLIWKFVPQNLEVMMSYAGFDQSTIASSQDNMAKQFSPGFFLIGQRKVHPYPQLVGMGSYREGDEVPQTPQTYV